jgi:hypothetical protein
MQRRLPRVRRRPFGVTLITALWLVYATLAILFIIDPAYFPVSGVARLFDGVGLRLSAHAGLALLAATSAVGLWFLRPWGWVASMLLAGVNLAVEIVLYFLGTPGYPYLAVAVVIAFYLNLGDVRGRFFAEADGAETGALEPLPDEERVGG